MALIGSVLDKGAERMRKGIARNGQQFVKTHTYKERINEMVNLIYGETI